MNNGVQNGVGTGGDGAGNGGGGSDPLVEFGNACGGAPDGAVIRIARVQGGQRVYLRETMDPVEWSPEWLAEKFGGGRYFVSLVAPGRAGYLKGATVQVEGLGAAGAVGAAANAVPPAAPSGGFDASSLMSAALAMMQTAMAQQTQVVTAILSRPSDGLKVADLLPILQGGGGSKGGGIGELVQALKAMHEMSGELSGGGGGGGDGAAADPLAGLAAAVLPSLLAAQKAGPASVAPVKARPRLSPDAALRHAQALEARARRAREFAARALGQRVDVQDAEAAAKSAAAAAHVVDRGGDEDGAAVRARYAAARAVSDKLASAPIVPIGVDPEVYAEERAAMVQLIESIGGAPEWLKDCVQSSLSRMWSAEQLGACVLDSVKAHGVELPRLGWLQWHAVLDLLTLGQPVGSFAYNRRAEWVRGVSRKSWGFIWYGERPDVDGSESDDADGSESDDADGDGDGDAESDGSGGES